MSARAGQKELLLPNLKLKKHVDDILPYLDDSRARFVLSDDQADHEIVLNEELYDLLRTILIDISQNKAVHLVPTDTLLTSVQSAEFLQVSRPFLIKLIDKGELPCQMVGTHRRIKLEDLIKYREISEQKSRKILDKMSEKAQDLGWES